MITTQQRQEMVAAAARPVRRQLAGGVRVLTPPATPTAVAGPAVATDDPTAAPTPDGVQELLAAAAASGRARTRGLAARITGLVEQLRTAVAGEVAEREAARRVAELRAQLADAQAHLEQARRGTAPTGTKPAVSAVKPAVCTGGRVDARAVRAWAAAHGIEVNAQGRVRQDVVDQWRQAQQEVEARG